MSMQKTEIIYQEKSSMKLWAFILIPLLSVVVLLDFLINNSPKFTQDPEAQWTIIIPILAFLLMYFIKLEWKFTVSEFRYRFFPFIIKERIIPYSDIQTMSVMKINPLFEFGGWGLRRGKLGKAYTTDGNLIIHMELKSGQKLNFTVKNKVEVERVIQLKATNPTQSTS
jgi:hypothetical protein